ncbi:NADP-dependent 3-hydroxy acid dehydrogenase YdfG [Nocardioides terrae]|uniref:NADP-dependent 3-hydroxy acid dehydrogenase YdfG n=1 Tax=Nocardioides terrae TaxID=574651 RepID=A0A1I1DQN8_9ACTN|nr:SDR family oxidoreductase [Nocardioides terrae]SFB74883.1 NADP-dependent 3-hydroxy acid dehydrogenase YdfG [Nocardioides terrae]
MSTRPAVLVSGSATGIGRAIVGRFARAGWLVGVYDIDAVGAERAVRELVAEHGAAAAVGGVLDVTVPEQWDAVIADFTEGSGGRLDLLVNNAGILFGGRFADVPLDAHLRTVDVNVKGVLSGCHAAHAALRATAGSGVINVCSASAIYGQAELASYSASKFAVRGLTEALEIEWRDEGIRVQAVWPLFVATAMTEDLHIASTDALGVHLTPGDVAEEVFAMAQPRRGLRRVLSPRVHTAVGLPGKVMAVVADVAPSLVSRAVNRRIARP